MALPFTLFVIYCFSVRLPISICQIVILKKYKKESKVAMGFAALSEVIQFGLSIYGIIEFSKINDCFYNIPTMFFTVYTCMMLLKGGLLLILICVILPCMIAAARRQRANEPGQNPLQNNMLNNLVHERFSPQDFTNQESCSICMVNFTQDDEIIPLPCDRRHYFHAACITQWLQ